MRMNGVVSREAAFNFVFKDRCCICDSHKRSFKGYSMGAKPLYMYDSPVRTIQTLAFSVTLLVQWNCFDQPVWNQCYHFKSKCHIYIESCVDPYA
jgi:hypothetical protein